MVPFAVLDLCPIVAGADAGTALRNSLDLARRLEAWGYGRIWFAEHHNMPGVASAATSVVITFVAAGTSRIRVGAGGIMLPNHAPLVIAEQFGTLEALFPGRIDLGVGRAPGTDQATARALRRHLAVTADRFPDEVLELIHYLHPRAGEGAPGPVGRAVQAIPGTGSAVPIWILGSSLFGAQLAAAMGLPYAFASHFAPAALDHALEAYRRLFRPSPYLEHPQVMVGANVIAADTDAEGRRLLTSLQQVFVQLRQGRPGPLPPPIDDYDSRLQPHERAVLDEALACTYVGTPATVKAGLQELLNRTSADELILSTHVYDHTARLRSFELTAELWSHLRGERDGRGAREQRE